MTNVFLYGRSGTGKTILSAEIVKIKLSQLLEDKTTVRVIVTQYQTVCECCHLLLRNFKEKYFKNIDSEVVSFKALCEKLNIKNEFNRPIDMINKVTRKLGERRGVITLLMVDEMSAAYACGQETPDWSNVTTADNIVWILSSSPTSCCDKINYLRPPVSNKVLSTKLLRGHRNCLEIRSVAMATF